MSPVILKAGFSPISNGSHSRSGKGTPTRKADIEDETNTASEEPTEEQEPSQEFTSIDLSPKSRSPRSESKEQSESGKSGESSASHKESSFLGRFRKCSVGRIFNGETVSESSMSIYTIDREMNREKSADTGGGYDRYQSRYQARQPEAPCETPPVDDGRTRTAAVQAMAFPPYRLHFLPAPDWRETESTAAAIAKLLLCQTSLACFLLVWLLSAALFFYLTEGSYEEQLVKQLLKEENSTMVSLATDLRLVDPEVDPWDDTLDKYMAIHREDTVAAVRAGYRPETTLWTFPGSLMAAVSILTTFGLATPLPETSTGKIGGFIFALIGIPVHLVFIVHLGRSIGIKTQLFAKETDNKVSDWKQRFIHMRRYGESRRREPWPARMFTVDFTPPPWLLYFPLISSLLYYLLGLLVFGVARGLAPASCFLFFTDFASGVHSNGFSRMGYAWYLAGGSILVGLNAALLRDAPFPDFNSLAFSMGLITNSIE